MRSFKYIIKRILIGTGIALLLGFIRGNLVIGVKAIEVDKYNIGETTTVVDNMTTSYTKTISGSPWASLNGSYGYINGTFSLSKVDGTSTSINIIPKQVYINSGNNSWVCNVGTGTINNSTFTSATYSYRCPIQMSSSGLTSLVIQFVDIQTNFPSMSRLVIGSLISFEVDNTPSLDTSGTTSAINNQISNDNSNTQSIINNQNSTTNSIINNQNQTTSAIINNDTANTNRVIQNQNQTTQDIINGKCSNSETALSFDTSGYYDENGQIVSNSSWTSTTQLKNGLDKIVIVKGNVGSSTLVFRIVEYDQNNQFVGVTYYNSSQEITLNKKHFYRFSKRNPGLESYNVYVCSTGLSDLNSSISDVNSTLNNDSVTGASTEANSFFSNFNHDSHGLSGIITAPLRLIDTFTTATCSPLTFNLPFVHDTVTLPCMRGIYEQHFGVFFSLYQLITTGIICYGVLINMYSKIHALQNPNNDRIEVLNL